MSHDCGTVQSLATPLQIGPDTREPATSGQTWEKLLPHAPAPGGTKFVILHFQGVSLPATNRLEVDLGYDTDVFTSADGSSFWTRPVDVSQVGGGGHVPLRYITDGSSSGAATVDRYGRGESLPSHSPPHDSITNCDPFLPAGWTEPVFPHSPPTTVPKYDPYWICDKSQPPRWQNARCGSVGQPQRDVAPSVGMIVTVHPPGGGHAHESVSTCSVTLIDSDLVLTAAHCVAQHATEVPTSSVTFDYEVACDGSVLPAYGARFFKVIKLVKFRYNDGRDYAILQIRGAPAVPPIPVRTTLPGVSEPVFGVHHPNGAVKKVSPSANSSVPVLSSGGMINVNLDVAGGSSGSGLFDLAGNVLGVCANGGPCSINYSAASVMVDDPIMIPDPPSERAVMLVLDRSGSMSGTDGGGHVKTTEAREAAELFVSMLRVSSGNAAGLASFASDASNPVEFPLAPMTASSRADLIATLPSIAPGGRTSIGDGLIAARDQFSSATPPRSMLVLTDGMENEPAAIADVTGLAGIEITAIGFGSESNLDGERLTDLAQTHGGLYKRAGSGLELRKFFALAFGEIFEAGALADPDLRLPADVRQGPWVPFAVCEEETVTVVIGWDTKEAALELDVRAPDGTMVDASAEEDSGATWRFVRIELPFAGQREGTWAARVRRTRRGGEFPPPEVDTDYFVNVNASGGPSLRPLTESRYLYTGDVLHPKVMLHYPDESVPAGGEVTLRLRRPATSAGTLLSQQGIGPERMVAGDVIPARQATLAALEAAGSAISYVEEQHDLADDAEGAGTFMPAGRFGKRLEDALVVEGNYTFHAKARVGQDCVTTREAQWTYHVRVGIDPDATSVDVRPAGPGSDDGRVRVTITPRDRYGNHVGPGLGDDLSVDPLPGCRLEGGLEDLGDGRYAQTVVCEPGHEDDGGIVVSQPGRPPVVLVPMAHRRTVTRFVVPLHCGEQGEGRHGECDCISAAPGRYATAVHALNAGDDAVEIDVRIWPTELGGTAPGRWPDSVEPRGRGRMVLQAGEATVIDCCTVEELLFEGLLGGSSPPAVHGVVELRSSRRLDVSATFTLTMSGHTSLDVERIEPTEVIETVARPRPPAPTRPVTDVRRTLPPPRPQDHPRQEEGSGKRPEKKAAKKAGRKGRGKKAT